MLAGSALWIAACTQFNTQHFMRSAFGQDLRPLMLGKEFRLGDGFLEVGGVCQSDPIHLAFFGADAAFLTSESAVFEGPGVRYHATDQNPVRFRLLGGHDGLTKAVLWFEEQKLMVFLYASGIL